MKGLVLLGLAVALAGCGDSVNNTPPAAAMAPRTDPAPKIPTTVDEKIAAIEKAGLPLDREKAEIARVKAGG